MWLGVCNHRHILKRFWDKADVQGFPELAPNIGMLDHLGLFPYSIQVQYPGDPKKCSGGTLAILYTLPSNLPQFQPAKTALNVVSKSKKGNPTIPPQKSSFLYKNLSYNPLEKKRIGISYTKNIFS